MGERIRVRQREKVTERTGQRDLWKNRVLRIIVFRNSVPLNFQFDAVPGQSSSSSHTLGLYLPPSTLFSSSSPSYRLHFCCLFTLLISDYFCFSFSPYVSIDSPNFIPQRDGSQSPLFFGTTNISETKRFPCNDL